MKKKDGLPKASKEAFAYDRFGNAYSYYEMAATQSYVTNDCSNSGVFDLRFYENGQYVFTNTEKSTICGVFHQVSELIAPGNTSASIRINMKKFTPGTTDSDVLGFASGYYSPECGLQNSAILETLKTGVNPFGGTTAAGYIFINPAISWHTTDLESDPVGNPPVSVNGFDLHSVMLHEIGHLLGFASNISLSGAPITGSYSTWDQFLSANGHHLIQSGGTGACCDAHEFNNGDFAQMPSVINNGCSDNIIFNHPGVSPAPPVNRLPPSGYIPVTDDGEMLNKLSHLAKNCPGGQSYVMEGYIDPGVVNRSFTVTEKQILCTLGYSGIGSCSANSGCMPIANNDAAFLILQGPSAAQFPYNVNLLSNDFASSGATLQILTDCGNYAGHMNITPTTDGFTITGTPDIGQWTVCYTLTATCGGITYCDQAEVMVSVRKTTVQTTGCEGCNLVCFGDFEDFLPGRAGANGISLDWYYEQLGIERIQINGGHSSPDIITQEENHNTAVVMISAPGTQGIREAIIVPLKEPVPPGCAIKIDFDAVAYSLYGSVSNASLKILALDGYDCSLQQAIANNISEACPSTLTSLCISNNAQGLVEGICVDSDVPLFFDNDVTYQTINNFSQLIVGGLELMPITTINWTNTTNQSINALLIYPNDQPIGVDHYIDNIHVSSCNESISVMATVLDSCSNPGTIDIEYKVCFDPAGETPESIEVLLTPQLPIGATSTGCTDPLLLNSTGGLVCVVCTLSVTLPVNYAAGDIVSIGMHITVPEGYCVDNPDATINTSVTIVDCTPDPLCNCPSTQSLTITAAANGSLYSELEALHNYDQNDDGIISFSEHNGCIAISGQLIIDRDVKIEGANMLMAPCSEIFVNRQNTTEYPTLSLEFDHIQACTTMWKGITVGNNCRLEMYEGSIRDAEFAVRAPGASDILEGPYSSIDIEDVAFIKNHVGIYMGRPGIKSWVSHGVLRNLTFIGNVIGQPLLPACTPGLANYSSDIGYAGIVAQSLASLSVGPIAGTGYSNFFQNIRNGIISEGPVLYAYRNSFEKIGTNAGGWGINSANQPSFAYSRGIAILTTTRAAIIEKCKFVLCSHSIYGDKNTNVIVRNNIINNGYVGMEFFAPKGLSVVDNLDMTFSFHCIIARELSGALTSKYLIARNSGQLGSYPIGNPAPEVAYPAVWISNTINTALPTGSRISDNDFNNISGFMLIDNTSNWTIDENTTNQFGQFGIRLNHSENNYLYHNTITNSTGAPAFDVIGSAGNRFCCNIAENTKQGIHFIGACGNTELRNTSFTKHTNPVFCEQGTAIGPQINYGNRFNQASGKATHLGSDGNILNSRFQVVDDLVPYYPESIYAPNQPIDDPWFIPEGTEKSCGNSHYTECQAPTPLPPVIPVNIKDLEKTIAEGGFYGDAYGDMLQWEGEQLLYAKLLEHADLLTADEAVNTFFSTHQNSKISAYQAVEAAIREIDAVPESLSASLQSLEEKIAAITDAIIEAIKKAEEMGEAETSAEIKKKIALLIADRDLFIDDQQKMLDEIAQLRSIGVQSAWVLNESLVAESVLEQNRKTVNKVYLETLAQYNTTLTTAQVEQISDIAHQCLLEGGNAVLDARILYQLYEPETFNEEELCAATGARSRTDINHSSNLNDAILLIPNPANDYLRITGLSLVDGQQASIALLDVNGKRVTEHTLSADQAGIPTHTLPEGIYFCRIMVDHQLIAIRRVVILH